MYRTFQKTFIVLAYLVHIQLWLHHQNIFIEIQENSVVPSTGNSEQNSLVAIHWNSRHAAYPAQSIRAK